MRKTIVLFFLLFVSLSEMTMARAQVSQEDGLRLSEAIAEALQSNPVSWSGQYEYIQRAKERLIIDICRAPHFADHICPPLHESPIGDQVRDRSPGNSFFHDRSHLVGLSIGI